MTPNGLEMSRPASQGYNRAETDARLAGIGRRSLAPSGVLREAKRRGLLRVVRRPRVHKPDPRGPTSGVAEWETRRGGRVARRTFI
jgi:hypothetical protein